MSHTTNELLRKALHIGFGLFALALKWIPWWAAAIVAAVAVLGNWLALHRIVGTRVARHERGYDAGIVLYPLVVMLLIVIFRDHIAYAGIVWAILAFGDGMATVIARFARIAPLPWNRAKSWGGFAAFVVFGFLAGWGVGWWLGEKDVLAIAIAVVAAAIGESLDLHINDNITVPFAASVALIIAAIHPVVPFGQWPHTPVWLIVNTVLALIGYAAKSVNFSGALGGWVLGTILIFGAGWPMYVALLAFFIIGSATTKLGYKRKADQGLAQEGGGRRGFSHAFSNVGVAAICSIAVSRLFRADAVELAIIAYLMGIASLATAAADTTASEVGQLIGRRAFLPLTLKRVPVGTEGAISIEGTVAGAIGGALVAIFSIAALNTMFPDFRMGIETIAPIALAAFLGSYIESLAGSWNRKQSDPIPNGVLNFFNTVAGAFLLYVLRGLTA
ncbi:MAG: hypothetical protein DMF56_25960 [Acidobacteria bacterium]|nr:MAG: hypothetical protein DMF56_25960 [Acidobacteriota bacterium]